MNSSTRSGLFSVSAASTAETKETKSNYPPQIERYLLESGEFMNDAAIKEIQAAIERIAAREEKTVNRYYGKTELAKEIGAEKLKALGLEKLPFAVDSFQLSSEDKTILCFKNPGLQGLNTDCDEHVDELQTRLFGWGTYGKVVPLHVIGNPAEVYAVKIKNEFLENDQEYVQAKQAGVAIAQCIRTSPHHNNQKQERIYMRYVQGVDLQDFLANQAVDLKPLDKIKLFKNILLAVKQGAHRFRAINRDLKPNNFKINPDTLECTLLDFGAQVTLAEGKEEYPSREFPGSLYFLAPELLAEYSAAKTEERDPAYPYSIRSDIYSLGIMLADFFGQVDPLELEADPEVVIYNCGISVTDEVTDDLKQHLKAPVAYSLFFEFIQLMTHKKAACRPGSIDDCVKILDQFAALILAALQCGNVKLRMNQVELLLEPLRKLAGVGVGVRLGVVG